ncbi:hypothetical protein SanaruYs_23090 [Chryseotalea sanaruensis]|uniref:DUF4177 domain-containing protein n=1 Tax=Chryseotalea sanaruensis TaxID=2482724 RepID=A0A401UB12_9BACT|nr:hypothetical protein [Chryseotalea sanaruensis]GCC52077.1 hypothetical protein SanaruYs_23090 [Chryseotalea sanaruensis]
MKYLIIGLASFISFTAPAQSVVDSVKDVTTEVYSMIVVNRYYERGTINGSIQTYFPTMVAPILQKNNTAVSFNVNLLNALNKHAEEGWSLVTVEAKDLKSYSNHTEASGGWTDNSLVNSETIYLFRKIR